MISPNKNDILCGKSGNGGVKFKHEGNKNFRLLVKSHKVYMFSSISQLNSNSSCHSQHLFNELE